MGFLSTGAEPFVVTLSGSGGAQIAGEDYTLTCNVTEGDTMTTTYRWGKNNVLLSLSQNTSTLAFNPLRQSDSGRYSCEATRGFTTRSSSRMEIIVEGIAKPVVIIADHCSLFVVYTDPALSAVITAYGQPERYFLMCEVIGDERLAVYSSTLRWDKDGMRDYSRNTTLEFNPLRPVDIGVYRCTSLFYSPYLTGFRVVVTQILLICKQ